MSNELMDIVDKLNGYKAGEGWMVISADKRTDGGWNLIVQPIAKEPVAEKQEATNENN